MVSEISVRRRLAILGLMLASATPVLAQETTPSAWRVECAGDGLPRGPADDQPR
jgi:hypothetical protein